MELSEVIKKARRDQGKTQADLADLLNVTPQYISRMERGVSTISKENAFKVGEFLGIPKQRIATLLLEKDLTVERDPSTAFDDETVAVLFSGYPELTQESRAEIQEHLKFVDQLIEKKRKQANETTSVFEKDRLEPKDPDPE